MKIPLLPVLCLLAAAVGAAPSEGVKLVGCGWKQPKLADLKANPKLYEEQAPFDGLIFCFPDGEDVFNPKGFGSPQKAGIAADTAFFKNIKFKRWKFNFLDVMIDQRSPEWFDDAAWKNILDNWKTVAKAAKDAGMVGIRLDSECYGVWPVNSYYKSSYWIKGDAKHPPDLVHDADAFRAKARERGREVGKVIFREFPNMIFFGYYLWSFQTELLNEFCNGILEEAPKTAKIADGDEWKGYCAKGEADFKAIAQRSADGYGGVDKSLMSRNTVRSAASLRRSMSTPMRIRTRSTVCIPWSNRSRTVRNISKTT